MRHRISGLLVIGLMLSLTFLTYTGFHPVRGSGPPNPGVVIWTRTETPPGSGHVAASGVAVDGTGVYVVGFDRTPGNDEWRIEKRSLGDGSVIWTQTEKPSAGQNQARYIAIDATGVYVAGVDNVPGNDEWRIEKRSLTTGAVIWTQTSNPSTGSDDPKGIAVDATGVYVVGRDVATSFPDWEWRIEKRSLTTGALVTTFGTAGVVQENPSTPTTDYADGVAIDASGLYVVGIDDITGSYEWRIEKRNLATGLLITTFGTGGIIREAISSGDDLAYAVAVDGSGMYIAGIDENTSGNYDEWRVEKLALNDGSRVSAFGSSGVVVEHVSSGHDDAYVVCVDGTGVYIAGNDQAASGDKAEWRIEKRNLGDGSPIWSQTEHPSAGDDYSLDGIAVDATGLYVVGADQAPGDWEWRVEKRNAVLPGLWVVGISLVQGWNLISLPVVPVSSAPKVALATVMTAGNVTIVWSYTGTPSPTWKSFNPALTSGNTLTAITDGMGLWVLMKAPSTLYAEGYVIPPAGSPSQYPLVAGWNLVSFKPIPDPSAPETVGTYLTSIPLSSYQQNSVFIYDNAAGTWTRADSGTVINPGQAFWILMLTPAKLAP